MTARDSKIDPITTTSTSTGDSECVSKYRDLETEVLSEMAMRER